MKTRQPEVKSITFKVRTTVSNENIRQLAEAFANMIVDNLQRGVGVTQSRNFNGDFDAELVSKPRVEGVGRR